MEDYGNQRQSCLGYIRNNLEKFTDKQLDTYARTVQCCLEENQIKTKLGVEKPRGFLMGYIRNYMERLTNAQLVMIVGDMIKRIEDNEMWNLYTRENWQGAW